MSIDIIYGDGTNEVAVGSETVIISQEKHGKGTTIAWSHAVMREVCLGWQRHEQMEREAPPQVVRPAGIESSEEHGRA